jgi:hypothetical protein
MITQGKYKPKTNKLLARVARAAYLYAADELHVHMHWVKGHSGNIFNDAADEAANKGRYEKQSDLPRHNPNSTDHYVVNWLTTEITTTLGHTKLDDITNIEEANTAITNAILSAARKSFPKGQMQPRTPWITNDTLQLIKEARYLYENDNK